VPVSVELEKGNADIRTGTAIATFDGMGRYPNHAHGNHAAIYISQDSVGIWVWDAKIATCTVTVDPQVKTGGLPTVHDMNCK
jgi:hypothetical protein